MSLLDDVSIVVTPNAYKAGTLYAVIPVPTYGSELAVNGDFAIASGWGSNYSISGGQLTKTSGGLSHQTSASFQFGVLYEVIIDVQSLAAATQLYLGGLQYGLSVGVQTLRVISGTANDFLGFNNGYALGVGSVINSISAKPFSAADMDVTRETAATRVNENGLVKYAQVPSDIELVRNGDFSEIGSELVDNGDFETDSDWNKTQATISNGVANISSDGSYAAIDQSNVSVIGKTYLYSIDVKSITGTMQFRLGSGTDVDITTIGIKTGYIVATSTTLEIKRKAGAGAINATIDNVSVKQVDPNDYWTLGTGVTIEDGKLKINGGALQGAEQSNVITSGNTCSVTFTVSNYVSGTVNLRHPLIEEVSENGTYTFYGAANSTMVFIRGNAASNEFSIDNVSVEEVDLNNVPRIDYTGGGCPHILAEPQSTNLVTYSEDFTNGYWGVSGTSVLTVTDNVTTSPDGTANACKVLGNGVGYSYLRVNLTTSNETTFTIFAKKDNWRYIGLRNDVNGAHDVFDFDTETFTKNQATNTLSFVKLLDGWYRLSVTKPAELSFYVGICIPEYTSGAEFVTLTNASIFIWGAQFEHLSYATSYIPTSGTSVTRNQDIFTRDGIGSLINSEEGVLFLEINYKNINSAWQGIALTNNNSANNRIFIGIAPNTKDLEVYFISGGATLWQPDFELSNINQFQKIAVKYKSNDLALWVNGVEVATSNSVSTMPVSLSALGFFGFGTSEPQYGEVRQLQVYKTALSDEQLLQLTGELGTDFYKSYAAMASALTYTIQ